MNHNSAATTVEKPRTLGFKLARDLSALEIEAVSGGIVTGESKDSWCQGCDGRCTESDN